MVNKTKNDTAIIDGIEIPNEERQPCEIWTRVMGYYRPISNYNTGKLGEFHERVEFAEPTY
jgi:anaerobic ribonucleoside-triphosphate reductase